MKIANEIVNASKLRKRRAFVRPRYDSPVSDKAIDVTVWLPMELVNELNAREHWRRVSERKKKQREAAGMAVASHLDFSRSSLPDSRYVVMLTRIIGKHGREYDEHDGLRAAFKYVADGVSYALEIDDASKRIEWRYAQERGREHGVRIEIKSA